MCDENQTNEESRLTPLDSARFIMERAKNVSINMSELERFAKIICNALMDGKYFDQDDNWIGSDIGPPKEPIEQTINWIFLVSTLNFSFWVENDSQENDSSYCRFYKNQLFYGYEALCAAINQAIDNGIDLLNASYYSTMTMHDFEEICRPWENSSPLPMLKERLNVLHETGRILLQEYQGQFVNCLKENGQSAIDLVYLVVKKFPSYRDESIYRGQKVSFYKRAQILVADIWGCFHGHSYGHFLDLDCLTMFADYRVPQVLSHEGTLVYSSKLKERLQSKEQIPFGDPDELEIRAASILSVFYLCNEVNEKLPLEKDLGDEGQRINAVLIDVFLWRRRRQQQHIYRQTPFHRTRSIFY